MVSGHYMPANKAKTSFQPGLAGPWCMHLLHASLWARVPCSDLNRRETDTKSNKKTVQIAIQIAGRTLLVLSQGPGVFFIATYDPLNEGFTVAINTGW